MTDVYQNYLEYLNHQFVDPSNALSIVDSQLNWYDNDLVALGETLPGTAFVTYLPAIRERSAEARKWIRGAIDHANVDAAHRYFVSIKANYWPWAVAAALEGADGLEISSPNDLMLVKEYVERGIVAKGSAVIVNGVKTPHFRQLLMAALSEGIVQPYIFADSVEEVEWYAEHADAPLTIGIRMKPKATPIGLAESRFGVHTDAIEPLMRDVVEPSDFLTVDAIHIQSYGTTPEGGYTFENYTEAIARFVELKQLFSTITQLNLGGGLFSHVYPPKQVAASNAEFIGWVVDYLVAQCDTLGVALPTILTELGSYNYAPATVFLTRTAARKPARANSEWLFIEGSIMNDLPDALLLSHNPFVPIALTHFDAPTSRYRLAGMTCDPMDWLDSSEQQGILLPETFHELPIAIFNCGAYQATLSGYGGLRHCLLDHPHQVFLDKNADGETVTVAHLKSRSSADILLEFT